MTVRAAVAFEEWVEAVFDPSADPLRAGAAGTATDVLTATAAALGEIRKAKTEAKRSMRTDVVRAVVVDTAERAALVRLAAADLAEAGRVADLVIEDGDDFAVTAELAPPE